MTRRPFPWPEDKARRWRRAVALEWVTLAALGSVAAVMYLAMGSSQAMKTAWIEDVLSLVPPVAFLIAARIERMPPRPLFPWGFLRAGSVAYLVSATALLGVAAFMIFESTSALLAAEHPTIGAVELFGETVWLGWVMLAALAYSVVPPVVLGHLKQPLARDLYDKVLDADARMNRADWMTGLAAVTGVIGIGFGLWWADATAALVIALDVARDGLTHVGRATRDLLDRRPATIDRDRPDPAIARVKDLLARWPGVRGARVSLRTEGRALTGHVEVDLTSGALSPGEARAMAAAIEALDWRLFDIEVAPARLDTCDGATPDEGVGAAADLS